MRKISHRFTADMECLVGIVTDFARAARLVSVNSSAAAMLRTTLKCPLRSATVPQTPPPLMAAAKSGVRSKSHVVFRFYRSTFHLPTGEQFREEKFESLVS
jgi:hypothetical protein